MHKFTVMDYLEDTKVRFGLITGLIYIILTLVLYVIDRNLLGSLWKLIPYLVTLGLVAYAAIVSRKEQGGYIGFKEALKSAFVVYLIAEIMWQFFNYSLYNIIDPELSQFMKEMAIETTESGMDKMGVAEEKIKETVNNMKEQDYTLTLGKVIKGLAVWLIIGFIYSMIVAGVVKRAPDKDTQS